MNTEELAKRLLMAEEMAIVSVNEPGIMLPRPRHRRSQLVENINGNNTADAGKSFRESLEKFKRYYDGIKIPTYKDIFTGNLEEWLSDYVIDTILLPYDVNVDYVPVRRILYINIHKEQYRYIKKAARRLSTRRETKDNTQDLVGIISVLRLFEKYGLGEFEIKFGRSREFSYTDVLYLYKVSSKGKRMIIGYLQNFVDNPTLYLFINKLDDELICSFELADYFINSDM